MDLGLKGQIVAVVGAASGMGLTISSAFAAEGAHVAMSDISPKISEMATQLGQEHGVNTIAHEADVTDYAQMGQVAAEVESQLGPVDHVVYTAGIGSGKTGFPFWNIEPHEWAKVFDVCLMGAVHTIHAFKDPMLERRRGTFCFLASVAGQIGSQTDPPYSAAKAALINFTQCAAKDMAPYDIRVNSMNPGMVDTALSHRIHAGSNLTLPPEEQTTFEEWFQEKVSRVIPLNRPQKAEEIADMVVFLASPRCRSVTGQAVNVDGGFVMHW